MLTVISDFGDVRMNSKNLFCVAGVSGLALLSAPAFAYLDPGTGSALIQGIIASLAAVGLVLKVYWHRVLGFLGLRRKEQAETESTAEAKAAAKLEHEPAVDSSAD